MEIASSINPKSHEGESGFETGKARRAPFMNLHTKGCCPTVLLSKSMYQADMLGLSNPEEIIERLPLNTEREYLV